MKLLTKSHPCPEGGSVSQIIFIAMQTQNQPLLKCKYTRTCSDTHTLSCAARSQWELKSAERPFSFRASSRLPFRQTTVNPQDFLSRVCCGHYNSAPAPSAAIRLNSKCVYTFLLISGPEVNRQVKSQRWLGEFCV